MAQPFNRAGLLGKIPSVKSSTSTPMGESVKVANILSVAKTEESIESSKPISKVGTKPTSRLACGKTENVVRNAKEDAAGRPNGRKTDGQASVSCRNFNGQPGSCHYGATCWFFHAGTKKTIKRREQRARAAQRKESAAQPPRASPNPSATVAAGNGNQTPANTAVRVKRARSSSPEEQVHSSAPSADGQLNLRQPPRLSAHIAAAIDGGSTSAAMPAPCT